MAKREKLKSNPKPLAAEDLQRVVEDIGRAKENASEYVGMAGQATKNAVERYALDRKALSFVIGLSRSSEAKRLETLRSAIIYADHLGFFSQRDLDMDILDVLKGIIDRNHNGAPSSASGGVDDANLDDEDDDDLDNDLTA